MKGINYFFLIISTGEYKNTMETLATRPKLGKETKEKKKRKGKESKALKSN